MMVVYLEAFADKRLLPGYVPRGCASKIWQGRLTITPQGFLVFLKFIDSEHRRCPTT